MQPYNKEPMIDMSEIENPLIPYKLYCDVMPESHNMKMYLTMIANACGFSIWINQDAEKKKQVIEKWLASFDEDSWISQAYASKILDNLYKFDIIASPVGFIDYIDVDESGYVTVNTLITDELKGMNNYGLFNTLLERNAIIPLLIRDKSLIEELLPAPIEHSDIQCESYDIFAKRIKLMNANKNKNSFSPVNISEETNIQKEESNSDENAESAGAALIAIILISLIIIKILPIFIGLFS